MPFYQFVRTQKIPSSMSEVWNFISSPSNLKEITPPQMAFEVMNDVGMEKMYAGMIIMYKVSPIFRFRVNWMTEITHVQEGEYFVDEQRIGPYKMWHHQHKIEEIAGGVLMTDIVTYQPPFGVLGRIANKILIRKKLNSIFDYRNESLEKKFGKFEK